MRLLISGGSGFIGNNFVRLYLNKKIGYIFNVDCLTSSSTPIPIDVNNNAGEYDFTDENIKDEFILDFLFEKFKPTHVLHMAACSHVDTSLNFHKMNEFVQTNVEGTLNLLKLAHKYQTKFLYVSTDEVYGSLLQDSADEKYPLNPSNPYAATKTAGEHLVNAFHNSFGLNTVISRCTNNYGPFQNYEKFIPNCINNLLNNKPITLYGDGRQVREWIYVKDHCEALLKLLHYGKAGQIYNIPGGESLENVHVANRICKMMGLNPLQHISYVEDRLGHDIRYSIKSTKMETLGFRASVDFDEGLYTTIQWYTKKFNKESKIVERK